MKKLLKIFIIIIILAGSGLLARTIIIKEQIKILPPEQYAQAGGTNTERPKIYLRGGNNRYGRGGIIPLSSLDEPSVEIDAYDVSGTASARFYKATVDNLLDYLIHDEKNNQKNQKINLDSLEFIAKADHKINTNNTKLIIPAKENGIFLVNLKINNIEENVFVVISDIGILAKEGDNEFVFWAQNFISGRSDSGGSLKIYNLLNKRELLAETKFDKEGIARADISSDADIGVYQKNNVTSIILLNLNYLNTDYRYEIFRPETADTKYFLFTDRPLYQPGDTVYFKSILRDDRDVEYSLPKGLVSAEVSKGYGENKSIIFNKNYKISAQGTIDGEIKLPEDISTGVYRLEIQVQDGRDNQSDWWWSDVDNIISFAVEYYQKPEYGIEISVPKDEYIFGDQLTFNILGRYFSGQPLAYKQIDYKIYSTNFYEWSYYEDVREQLSSQYRYGYWGGNEIKTGQAILDEQGNAIIGIEQISTAENKSQVYTIEASFKDESGRPVAARKNILVRNGEFSIYRTNWQYGVKAGDKAKLDLKLVSHKDNGSSNISLNAKIHRTYWNWKSGGWNNYTREEEDLSDMNITTDDKGEATLEFTAGKLGSYEIEIIGKDKRGNTVKNIFYIWVSDYDGYYYDGSSNSGLSVKAEKEKYAPDETARFSISSDLNDRDVFFSFERGYMKRFKVVHLNGRSASVEMPLVENDIPNIYVNVSNFGHTQFNTAQDEIQISTNSKKINVFLQPDQDKYGPGDTVILNLQTTDASGNSIPAEVAVWTVDKALFELADSNTRDIFKTFWSKRYNNTQDSHSLKQIIVYGAERGGCFTFDTKILMSDKTYKNITNVQIGDYILTKANKNDDKLVKAKVVGFHSVDVDGYLIINGRLKITPNHKLLVNNEWQEAGIIQIGDTLINSGSQKETVSSIEWQKGKYKVYNLEIENYHTFFADNIFVHNDKGDVGRSIFKDAAYWNPAVHTDKSGQARVFFQLPDNLTTWVISGIATTAKTQVGQTMEEIVVTKDIIVRPILPNILRNEDEIMLSTLVQNFTDTDYDFNVNLSFDSGEVFNSNQEITIKSQGTEQLYWPVIPQKVNDEAKLTFSAIAKDNSEISDIITQKIPIRDFGFFETYGVSPTNDNDKSYFIKLNENTNKEKTAIDVSIASTLIGSLPSAMKYLVSYPYGCMEQTTSKFMPVVIAKENPKLLKEAIFNKDLDSMIKAGVKRLISHQQDDGGWAWWHSGNSDPFITVYVLEYLIRAKQTETKFNEEIINNAKNFFKQGNFEKTKENNIYRTFALSLFEPSFNNEQITDFEKLSPDAIAMAVLANINNGHNDPQTNGLNKLISLEKKDGEKIYWEAGSKEHFGSIDASTAMALQAIVAGNNNHDIADKAAQYLTKARKSYQWANSYATARAIQALVDFATDNELQPDYTYIINLDNKTVHGGKVKDFNQIEEITINGNEIKNEGSTLTIIQEGVEKLYPLIIVNEFCNDKEAPSKNNGFEIARSYFSNQDENHPFNVGDIVNVRLVITNKNDSEQYGIIEDFLPAGLSPINTKFKNEQFDQDKPSYYDYDYGSGDEVTENGMIFSLYKVPQGTKTYNYQARVVSAGTFSAPPAKISLMYEPEVNGHSKTEIITTKAQPYSITKTQELEIMSSEDLDSKTKQNVKKTKKQDSKNLIFAFLGGTLIIFIVLTGCFILFQNKKNKDDKKKDK